MIVSREAIARISVPAGERELLYDSFEGDAVSREGLVAPVIDQGALDDRHSYGGNRSLNVASSTLPLVYSFPHGPSVSRMQFWFRVDDVKMKGQAATLKVEFAFESDQIWHLEISPTNAALSVQGRASLKSTKQSVAFPKGWHCLTAAFQSNLGICVIDNALLVATTQSPGSLRSLRLAATANAWVDDLQVSQSKSLQSEFATRPSTQDDCVSLHDGDQWFGRIKQVTPAAVVMIGSAGDRRVAWRDLDEFALRQPDRSVAGQSVPVGLWAEIELQSYVDRPMQPADRITAAITQVHKDCLVVAHPWLGEIAIGWDQVARLTPLFYGRSKTVDGRRLHLGDSIRADFERPIPDGTDWRVEFEIPTSEWQRDSDVWLTLDVTELEPSGPGTPPASPFLKELRAGRLLTEVHLNDEPAGDLNRWIRFRAAPNHPERIRCRLPASLLHEGTNTIMLRQVSLKGSTMTYDNCELSNLRIEFIGAR